MLFADLTDGLVGAGIAGVITAAGAVMVNLITAARKYRDGESATKLAEHNVTVADWKSICDRQEQQIARLSRHVEQQAAVIARQQVLHAECRAQVRALFYDIGVLHAVAVRNREILISLGKSVEPVPDMRPLLPSHAEDEGEYMARTSAEDTGLTQELNEKAHESASR